MVTKDNLKTLKIKESTHKKLAQIGFKNETFDDIIKRLISNQKKK